MAVGKEIRGKIKSVENTKKITKAMEMVAASKMRKAQDRMRSARPYAEKVRNIAAHLGAANPEYVHPFMKSNDVKKTGLIVVTTDKGLCGGMNTNVLRAVTAKLRELQGEGVQTETVAIGNKGLGFLTRVGAKVVSQATQLGDTPHLEKLIGPVKVLLDQYEKGELNAVYIAYTRFINTMKQESVIEQLLPLSAEQMQQETRDSGKQHSWDYLYEPDAQSVIDDLLVRYVEALAYQAVAENMASEQSARMVAAPTAPIKETDEDKEAKREEDRLLVDPVAAYAAQRESLEESLAKLREAEMKRTDRFEPKSTEPPVIEVKDLCIKFPRHGDVNVVDHVSFVVRPRQTMGLVGESGCGKSITSLTIMGLLDPKAKVSGEILYDGQNLLNMDQKQMNALRGREIAMIYQDALSSLNPSMLIKAQMKQLTKRGGTRTAEELLELVGLDPKRTLDSYPHELSGGQRQRVLIAMALTRDPKLIIADEPTTALDVTVQKQVIDLLNKLQKELGFAMVFVSHDLALVAEVANSITVMYAGQVVEQGPVSDILCHPVHEYTRGLLGSVLSIEAGGTRLHQVPGSVPSPKDFPEGDRFTPRSSHPDKVSQLRPVLKRVSDSDHYYAELPDSELKRLGIKPYVPGGAII